MKPHKSTQNLALKKPVGTTLRYRLRLALIPLLARALRLMGASWPWIGDRLGRESLIGQVRTIEAGSNRLSDTPLDIIFLTMIGGHGFNATVDVTLGLALKARGHRVRFVICDQALPVCETKKFINQPHWQSACGKCWAFARSYFQSAGLEVIPVSSMLSEFSMGNDQQWKHVVEAALLKHYQVGVLPDDQNINERRRLFQGAASISARVGRVLADMRPDRVIMSHGIYCTWGPAREILNKAGIPVVTYSKGKKRHTEKFNWTESADWWDVATEWERVKDRELTPAQQASVDQYLLSRRDHSRDTLVYNFGPEQEVSETRRRFGLDPDRITFTLFTNVLWDAASAQREIVFANPIEWVVETIRWFAHHPDRQLIVKIHPAEKVIGTRQPFAEILAKEFPLLPENVRIIDPGEEVNSWSILQVTDLGLVHTSTVGMELPLQGIPVACVSRTHYRGRGFTFDITDREKYFRLLEGWRRGAHDMTAQKAFAIRYAHLLFERYQLPWNVIYEPSHTDVRALNFTNIDQLTSDRIINLVISSIESKTDFLQP
jgi:hypothetical protein